MGRRGRRRVPEPSGSRQVLSFSTGARFAVSYSFDNNPQTEGILPQIIEKGCSRLGRRCLCAI
eukprot:scaffold425_cov373-Pinguiococcus_pyrenoidosus.AAC.9